MKIVRAEIMQKRFSRAFNLLALIAVSTYLLASSAARAVIPDLDGTITTLTSTRRYLCLVREEKRNLLVRERRSARASTPSLTRVDSRRLRVKLLRRGKRSLTQELRLAELECRKTVISKPTPTPDPDRTPAPTPTPGGEPTPTPSPTPDATVTTTPTPSPTPSATPTPEPTPTDEVCFDGIDNDLDLAIDDEDTDCQSTGITYYFSSSDGDDGWSGRQPVPNETGTDGPKRSLAAAQSILRNEAMPGDQVLLRRGDVWLDHNTSGTSLVLSNIQGDPHAPIILGAYGNSPHKPRLDIGGTGRIIISITGATRYLIIRDIELTTTAPLGARPQGISIIDCSGDAPEYVTLDRLEIRDLKYGITIQSNHITLKNSIISNNFKSGPLEGGGHTQGLFVGKQCGGGNFVQVTDNVFENNGDKESVFDWNAYLECLDCSFERNYVTDGSAGLKVRNTSRITVRDNIFSDIASVGISVGGNAGILSEDILIERNLFRRTIDGISVTRQSTGAGVVRNLAIINNIFMDNLPRIDGGGDYSGYLMYSTNDEREHVLIAHNTFHQIRYKSALNINIGDAAERQTNVQIAGNIFEMAAPEFAAVYIKGDPTGVLTVDSNLYDAERVLRRDGNVYFDSIAAARVSLPEFEPHGIEGESALTRLDSSIGELPRLTEHSQARDHGPCFAQVPADFFNTERPSSGCDLGAEEY